MFLIEEIMPQMQEILLRNFALQLGISHSSITSMRMRKRSQPMQHLYLPYVNWITAFPFHSAAVLLLHTNFGCGGGAVQGLLLCKLLSKLAEAGGPVGGSHLVFLITGQPTPHATSTA